MSECRRCFPCQVAIVVGYVLIVCGAKAQTAGQQTIARLPSVPAQTVEIDRRSTAINWNSRFCTKWTDECSRCFKQHPLSDRAVCEPMQGDSAACSPSAVRCLEFDPVIAPLFCTWLRYECGGAALSRDFSPASNDECFPRKDRPPIDWVCVTPTMVRDDCLKYARRGEGQGMKQCLEDNLNSLRHYRRTIEQLVRDSKRHDLQ